MIFSDLLHGLRLSQILKPLRVNSVTISVDIKSYLHLRANTATAGLEHYSNMLAVRHGDSEEC